MDSQVNYIRQRLSLRKPLANALKLTARADAFFTEAALGALFNKETSN